MKLAQAWNSLSGIIVGLSFANIPVNIWDIESSFSSERMNLSPPWRWAMTNMTVFRPCALLGAAFKVYDYTRWQDWDDSVVYAKVWICKFSISRDFYKLIQAPRFMAGRWTRNLPLCAWRSFQQDIASSVHLVYRFSDTQSRVRGRYSKSTPYVLLQEVAWQFYEYISIDWDISYLDFCWREHRWVQIHRTLNSLLSIST